MGSTVLYLSLRELLATTQLPWPLPNSTPTRPPATLYRFEEAKGSKVTAEDLANEDLDDEDAEAVSILSQSSTNGGGTPKRKGKGKGKNKAARLNACKKLVGAGVRKYFPRYDEEFDGEVGGRGPFRGTCHGIGGIYFVNRGFGKHTTRFLGCYGRWTARCPLSVRFIVCKFRVS